MSDAGIPLRRADPLAESAAELDVILANSHPLMAEAFSLASIPHWYDLPLFAPLFASYHPDFVALLDVSHFVSLRSTH